MILKPGDIVKIKELKDISEESRSKKPTFTKHMKKYCGTTHIIQNNIYDFPGAIEKYYHFEKYSWIEEWFVNDFFSDDDFEI